MSSLPDDLEAAVEELARALRQLIGQRPVALFDRPSYPNAGDHFIWLGQKVIFKSRLGCKILYECSLNDLDVLRVARLPAETVLVMQGGGNFGDLWGHHQRFREAVIAAFPDRRIVVMPQSVHFASRERLDQAARGMALHPDLHVMARDADSLAVLRSQMGLPNTGLHIDSAFALHAIVTALQAALAVEARHDVVHLLRRDLEAAGTTPPAERGVRADWARMDDLAPFAADLPPPGSIDPARDIIDATADAWSWQILCSAIRLIGQSRRIVTDRLHGHILAIMMGKEHELHDNSYGKNSSFYTTWTHASPLVTFVGETPRHRTASPQPDRAVSRRRSGRYAIVTPYHKESHAVLERCMKSVRQQTAAADHFLVADGVPMEWIDSTNVRHIRLDRSHADYGDTPRGIGAMIAASEGYESVGFLDADCWLEPDHVEYCLGLAKQAAPDGCDYVIALRHERRPDGTIMNVGQVPPERHVDTNCYFFFRSSFHVFPVWSSIPREVSIVGDRVFYRAVKANCLRPVVATRKTVNYTCMWESIYRVMGERPPDGAKPNPDHDRVQRWISELTTRDRAAVNRLIQTKLEDLYPLDAATAASPTLLSDIVHPAVNSHHESSLTVVPTPPPAPASARERCSMPTVGLCMIVKDEARIILRCLESVRYLVDYVLIEDTGSTDGTQEIIRDYLRREHIPGAVIEEPWKDFAYNRTVALAKLRERAEIDYALIMDADDVIVCDVGFDATSFKAGLTQDLYHVEIRLPPIKYFRPQICRNSLDFKYRGVLHEFVEGPASGHSTGTVTGFHILSGREGARSQNPQKYQHDAAILERALETEQDPFLISRYTFYLAQSCRDAGDKEKALRHYLARAELGFWDQEIFVSLYNAAKMKEALNRPDEDIIGSFLKAYEACPARAESLHGAMRYCRTHNKFRQGHLIGKHAVTIPQPASGLFVESWIYEYGLLDELAVNAYWAGDFQTCLDASEQLLKEARIPEHHRPRIEMNADFARKKLPKAAAPAPAPPSASSPSPVPPAPSGGSSIAIVDVKPAGDPHSAGYQELADTVVHGLRQLGRDVRPTSTIAGLTGPAIVIGAHLLTPNEAASLPPETIIYNIEHASRVAALGESYRALLGRCVLWDYSEDNAHRLAALIGRPVAFVPIGYAPELTRIETGAEPDIDVLFYGSINQRRQAVLAELTAMDLRVHQAFGVYGPARDALIRRSTVVLNMHFYEPGAFEIVRVSYLLANRKAVVTECNAGESIDADLSEAVVAVPYAELAAACRSLVADDARRRGLEEEGFRAFSRRDEAAILQRALDRPSARSRPVPQSSDTVVAVPPRLNLGSGKSWRQDFLNVDIDPETRPDLVLDVCNGALFDKAFPSPRFGEVRLARGTFEEIVASDVLEHCGDLTAAMTNCLDLLAPGGVMKIGVPYDLSYGAWQDPTHVHAFNERSWLYYCEWHWYLGWMEARFDLVSLHYDFSPLGLALKQRGTSEDEVARTARAVDGMRVVLQKRLLSAAEREAGLRLRATGDRPRSVG